MRSLAPTQSLSRRASQALGIAFVLIAIGVFLIAVSLGLYVFPLVTDTSRSATVFKIIRTGMLFLGVVSGLAGLGLSIRAVTWRKENESARLVAEALSPHFDESFTFIRNINNRSLGYIDAAMVGPPGVLIFRVLEWEGKFLNEGSGWMKPGKGNNWVPTRGNPTRQVIEDIKKVRAYLAEYGLTDVDVFGVIVFIYEDPKVKLILKDPVVPTTHLTSLNNRLYEHYLSVQNRIDPKTVRDVAGLLFDK